jgi:hypothetical protein
MIGASNKEARWASAETFLSSKQSVELTASLIVQADYLSE